MPRTQSTATLERPARRESEELLLDTAQFLALRGALIDAGRGAENIETRRFRDAGPVYAVSRAIARDAAEIMYAYATKLATPKWRDAYVKKRVKGWRDDVILETGQPPTALAIAKEKARREARAEALYVYARITALQLDEL